MQLIFLPSKHTHKHTYTDTRAVVHNPHARSTRATMYNVRARRTRRLHAYGKYIAQSDARVCMCVTRMFIFGVQKRRLKFSEKCESQML